MKLYSYWRSSAAWRVRIALNLKRLEWETGPVHLVRNGGEQRKAAYLSVNPQGLVPVLEDGQVTLSQSLAIIEYLEERYPSPPLLPADPASRARVRSLALLVACDVHPLNNLRVLKYLTTTGGFDEAARDRWYRHWIASGFEALERRLADEPATGRFCHGDVPGLADCCLVPQVYNARRFDCDLRSYPNIRRIEAACGDLEAFAAAAPDRQPDA